VKTILLKHDEVDIEKWDECIAQSPNGLIYAESRFLNHMSPGWYGIVAGDYQAVMPLCQRTKLGIRYLYQPAFCQQGGIFFKEGNLGELEAAFLPMINSFCRFGEINLNFAQKNSTVFETGKERNNFLRDLSCQSLNEYINTRLKRLKKYDLQYHVSDNAEEIISSYRQLYLNRIKSIKNRDFENFHRLSEQMQRNNRVIIRKVTHSGDNKVFASCLLLTDSRRIYNIINNLMPEGRKSLANYFLFQQLFLEFKDSGKIFDFEGSDLKGVGYFYEKFATRNEPYFPYRFNNLPKAIRWVKD